MEVTNLQKLKEAGGSFPLTKQIGYGNHYLVVNMEVTGDGYHMVKVTFTCSAGMFMPTSPVFLDPQDMIAENLDYSSGHMKLHINHIELAVPTPEQNGALSLNCSFTDINGQGSWDYNGVIGEWTAQGPIA